MPAWLLPFLAVAAGVVSISSPCVLPLIPGYVSYMTALPVSEVGAAGTRRLVLRTSLLFVAGFTLVFTILGASSALVGTLLLRNLPVLVRWAGVGIIALGLAMIGWLKIPGLGRGGFGLKRFRPGGRSAFGMGMAFSVGWIPCIGPVLGTILAAAAATETVAWGAFLLALYSLGLGIPFVLIALGFHRARRATAWLRRNGRRIEVAGGVMVILVGVAFVAGWWQQIFIPLQRAFARLGWPPI